MPPISELSRSELMCIIWHHLPDTMWDIHPCRCTVCERTNDEVLDVKFKDVAVLEYICDGCVIEEQQRSNK